MGPRPRQPKTKSHDDSFDLWSSDDDFEPKVSSRRPNLFDNLSDSDDSEPVVAHNSTEIGAKDDSIVMQPAPTQQLVDVDVAEIDELDQRWAKLLQDDNVEFNKSFEQRVEDDIANN